jgi:hypothetical protein
MATRHHITLYKRVNWFNENQVSTIVIKMLSFLASDFLVDSYQLVVVSCVAAIDAVLDIILRTYYF